MKKKIVFVDGNLNTGGAERIFCTLVRNIDRVKFEVEVIITGKPGKMCELLPDSIKVVYFNISRSRYACFALAKYLKKSKPDVIFSVSYNSAFAVLLAKFLCRGKFRISVRHCLMPQQMIREKFIKPKSFMFKINRWLMSKLDCIIAEHKYMAEEVLEVYKLNPSKVSYALNPLDELLINNQINTKSFSFPENQINIVAAGRINREKGFDFLVSAFSLVVRVDARFHLYIIGENIGNNQHQLEEIAKKNNCMKNIHFEGFQQNPYKYFNAADLFVLSSRWEASPNVIFENLYLGKRIVATNCSPILKDVMGSNGVLVEWENEDAMKDAILNYADYSPRIQKYYSLEEFYSQIIGDR